MHFAGARQGWDVATSADAWVQAKRRRSSPSQDPDPSVQQPIDEHHSARERKTVFLGGALLAGIATGVAAGTALAGPPGVLVGCIVGAIAGGLGGMAAGAVRESQRLMELCSPPNV
jgi:hypothetical protein